MPLSVDTNSLSSEVSYQPREIRESCSPTDVVGLAVTSSAASETHSFRSLRDAIKDDILQQEQEASANALERTNTFLATMEGDVGNELLSRRRTRTSIISQTSLASNQKRLDAGQAQRAAGEDARSQHEKLDNIDKTDSNQDLEDDIPDGGFAAWITAVAALMLIISSWGANSAYGVFLRYYLNNAVFDNATEYDYAWIGCIVVFLAQALAPFALLLVPVIGFRETLFLGTVLNFLGYLLASFAVNIWQLYLTQGVLVGISFSFLFVPGSVVIPQWFSRKRALASGLVVSGAGAGGIIFSLSVDKIIDISGNQKWALRYLALATSSLALVATILIRNRTFKKQPLTRLYFKEQFAILFDLSILKEFSPLTIGFWFGFMFLGYSVELFTLADYASSVGLSAQQGSILTAVFNVGQLIGRPSLGFVADKLGRINFTLYCTIFNLILYFAFWINANTYASLIAFALISGLTMGVGSLMMQPLSADNISSPSKFPASYSLVNLIVGVFGLVSEPITLALRDKNSSRQYLHSQIFGGLSVFVAVLIMLSMREWKIRKVLKSRLKTTLERLEDTEPSGNEVSGNEKVDHQNIASDKDHSDQVSHNLLLARKEKYNRLLKHNLEALLIRLFYPLKI